MRRQPLALVTASILLPALFVAGCDNDSTGPTPTQIVTFLDVFTGPLDPFGQSVFPVEVAQDGPVQVMLAGVVLENPLRSISPVLELGIGDIEDTTCKTVETNSTTPRFTAGLHRHMPAGTHCVTVTDKVGLAETVGLVVRIVSPPVLSTGGQPGTETFASTITKGGRATRSIDASAAGTIRLTLNSLLPSNPATGLALGLPATDGSGCQLAQIVTVTPGSTPQLTANVDAGPYCMAIFDAGNFASTNSFASTIEHP